MSSKDLEIKTFLMVDISVLDSMPAQTTLQSLAHICFCNLLKPTLLVVLLSRVLNEFILKNPNLESKKDQRELQVVNAISLTPFPRLVVSVMSFPSVIAHPP